MENEESAFDLYSDWYSFYHTLFERVLERVLAQYDKKDVHLYIEKLELDLGEISKKDFYYTFPLLLEEKLKELMKKLTLTNKVEEVRQISNRFLFFESFTYYLIHGFYPWLGNNSKDDFKKQFSRILEEYPDEFREFLFNYGHYSSLRRRLILQLENEGLEGLIDLINHVESSFIIFYFNLLINKETPQRVGTGKVSDHRNACWEVILAYLLVKKGGYFDRKEFVDQTIRELAAHYNIGYLELLSFLTITAERFLLDNHTHSDLRKILIELNEELIIQDVDEEVGYSEWFRNLNGILRDNLVPDNFMAEEFIRMLGIEQFKRKLLAGFTYGQLVKLTEMISANKLYGSTRFEVPFSSLLESSILRIVEIQVENVEAFSKDSMIPAIYLSEIRKLLKQPQSRRALILKLDETAIHGLVKILAPNDSSFIISYAKSLDEQKEKNIFEGKAGGEFRQLKWEFIFAVMIEDADMSFNRKSFVLSVVSMLASHYNIKNIDLLSYIYKAILDGKLSVSSELTAILGELYFESKAERPKQQEVNLFDKVTREAWYSSLLLEFIQTGIVTDTAFTDKLFDLMVYLETYRPDLLLSVLEALKKGFALSDSTMIPHHKELYRKLIQFTIYAYQINLPGGQKVKSLFNNIDEDRFLGVSVSTFKILLLALLRNDPSLYEKAWDVLTEKAGSVKLLGLDTLKVIPGEVLLKIISISDNGELQALIISEPGVFMERILSSFDLLAAVAECYRINQTIELQLEQALQDITPSYLFKKLYRLFPSEGEPLKILFRLLAAIEVSGEATGIGRLVIDIITALVKNHKPFFESVIRQLFQNRLNINERKTATKFLSETVNSFPTGSSLKKSIDTLIGEMTNRQEGAAEQEQETTIGEKGFISWLMKTFPVGSEFSGYRVSGKSPLFYPVAYAAFEKMMIKQPELIRQLILDSKLSLHAITGWVKSSPLSMQLRWLQLQAPPFQKVVVEEAFILINWFQTAIAGIPGASFSWARVTALLIDFTSGKLQYIDRDELFSRIMALCLERIDIADRNRVLDKVKSKASNHGQLWGKRIERIMYRVVVKEEKEDDVQVVKSTKATNSITEEEPGDLEEIYISNAGLVLCSPFLPQLFNMLGLLQDGVFPDRIANERAVLLLQYMLYHDTFFPEYQMVLNKVLCGLTTGTPVDCAIEVSEKEKMTMEQMLNGMIQHWGKLGHTSVDGLIESFLRREGKLVQKDDGWLLTVEQKSFDMLLDSLPWSYTPIKHRWMKKSINVKWR